MPTSPLPLLLPAQDPAPVEAATEAAGHALEQALLPLFVSCEKALARPELSDYQFQHMQMLRAALDAVAAYDTQVQQELGVHRANVAALNQQLHQLLAYTQPRPLEQALQIDWQGLALTLLERFCSPSAPVLTQPPSRGRALPAYERHLVRLGLLLATPEEVAALSPTSSVLRLPHAA
ncbi:hypothetical protein [Hymenobacter cheonanensis]|uniref:hypothetical protein n=1 Tax=Hymenobacter sp. CA2-7 TaxID=3063993 RepID=UPI0027133464|nr:hypothetical protein [Hymenobacter sp. CA2-7]MDO7886002.1 hypothetical protein [Hymenobacter sp. CA2-7]